MMLETDRLELVPLTVHQLRLWAEDMPALEKELHCSYKAEPLTGIFLEIVKGQLAAAEKDESNYLWHSFWLMIRKFDRIVTGSLVFKNLPNEQGEVEIGYGLGKEYEHNGYMTEAVKVMCGWALNEDEVKHIVAETDLDGFASHSILKRCGFHIQSQGETVWWIL